MEKLIACIIMIASFIFIDYIVYCLFSTLFVLTGLSKEKARTQTLALLTMCGYSTKESELIVNYRLRRKIANICIVTGYFITIVITSVVLGVITSLDFSNPDSNKYIARLLLTLGISAATVILLILITKIKVLRKVFFNLLKRMLLGKTADTSNHIIFGDHSFEKFYATVYLNKIPEVLYGKSIKDINFKAANIIILSILLPDGTGTDIVDDAMFVPGMTINLFGEPKMIKKIFERN